MVKTKFVDLSHSLAEKWVFLFCKKPFLMDTTRSVGQKWLANELDLHFLTLKKCIKGQSNRSILSKVIVLTNYKSTDRHTDRQTHSRKPFFRVQRFSKRGHLTKTGEGECQIAHKSNTFSGKIVKIKFYSSLTHSSRRIRENHFFGFRAGLPSQNVDI